METGVNKAPAASPPLEHPYAALALALALSGSQRWAAAREAKAEGGEREGDTPVAESVQEGGGGRRPARDKEGGEREGAAEILADFDGDSSRLWSSDSSDESGEREGGPEEEEEQEEDGVGMLSSALPVLEHVDEGGTREWLQAFEDDGEGSPRADGE